MEGYQVADTQSPVANVIYRLALLVILPLRYPAQPAHSPVVHIRCTVSVFGHCRHLLPLRERVAGALREDLCCNAAYDGLMFTYNEAISPTITSCAYMDTLIFKLQVSRSLVLRYTLRLVMPVQVRGLRQPPIFGLQSYRHADSEF